MCEVNAITIFRNEQYDFLPAVFAGFKAGIFKKQENAGGRQGDIYSKVFIKNAIAGSMGFGEIVIAENCCERTNGYEYVRKLLYVTGIYF